MSRRPVAAPLALLAVAVTVTVAVPGGGGGARAGQASIEALHLHPTSTANGYVSVDGALTAPHLGLTGGLFVGWAHDPLVLRDRSGAVPPGGRVIGQQLTLDLVASFAIADRVEIGAVLPTVPYQETDNTLARLPRGLRGAGLGDLRIDVKVRAHTFTLGRAPSLPKLSLAVIAGLRAPTGDNDSFLGHDGWSGFPRAVVEVHHERYAVALNFGAVLRSTRTFTDLAVTHQIAYALAGRYAVFAWRGHLLDALAELSGLVGVGLPAGSSLQASEAPLEASLAMRFRARFGLHATVGGSVGLTRGYGTPDGRLFFGLRYESPPPHEVARVVHLPLPPAPPPAPADADGDGLPDDVDRCPDARGTRETLGCPGVDSDGDGLVDRLDKCPLEYGDKSREGCPVEEPDHDRDGVPDSTDRCPAMAGSIENEGCPDIDSDGDGLVDRLDKCPLEAEVYNGNDDEDGCPDNGAVVAELTDTRILLKQPIGFEGDTATLTDAGARVVGVVARLLVVHPEIARIRVEGHLDKKGLDGLEQSRARAAAVRRQLVEKHGIDPARVIAQGYGADRPIADNRTAAGRARNRRIELVIVERAGADAR
jgi:outer membrane protein OmpA-like peptidoglycan-associated protein